MASEEFAAEIVKIKDQFGVDKYRKGWYFEPSTLEGDLAIGVKIKKILFHEKSKYQDIWIFESTCFGRVLVLDDIIQLTETDAFVYNEMASFLPLNSHPNPKKGTKLWRIQGGGPNALETTNFVKLPLPYLIGESSAINEGEENFRLLVVSRAFGPPPWLHHWDQVLIIGCGDGGLVREITKHPLVESIILCEIDQVVIDASKKYLPFASKGFESPKLTLYVGNGSEYIRKHKGEFDVIINDAPDPTGPAMSLYKKPYYESLKQALKPGGILMSQGFVFWLDLPVIKEVMTLSREVFPVVNYATSFIGSYPGGNLGYVLCSISPNTDFRNPIHKFSPKDLKEMGLKYYTSAVHRASMALPLFLAEELGLKWEN